MNKIAKGNLWAVAAPSGGGKTSLVEAAVEKMDNLVRSISFTTREKRKNEIAGKDYYFVDKDEFERLIKNGSMLEYELVFDNYYGTSKDFIEKNLAIGKDVILTIDWQGSQYIRKQFPDSRGIFILPPNIKSLEKRLRNRGQDNEQTIANRMAKAKEQASHYHEFDYLIINDNFAKALAEIITIFAARRLHCQRQAIKHAKFIQNLLK